METKAFYQVSDRAAHYAAPTKNDPSFLIFGEEVCRIFADTGMIRKVIRAIDEGTDAAIFIFTPGKTTPEELLSTYQGWGDYAFISKSEYNQLARAIGAEVVREGEEKYSPAVRNFEHLFKARGIIFDLRILVNRLNETWTEADNDSPIHPALNNSSYPFDESFDELVPRINEWLKEAEARILQSEICGEPLPEYESVNDYGTWESIAKARMKEIYRLRRIIGSGAGFNATFVKAVRTEQTGGNVMVDAVTLSHLPFVLGISEHCVTLYKSEEEFLGDEDSIIANLDFPEVKEDQGRYMKKDEIVGLHVDGEITRMRNRQLVDAIQVLNGLIAPKYYVVKVWGDVEPELSQPCTTEAQRDELAKEMKKKDTESEGENYSGFFWLNIINGVPEIGSYTGIFFEEETIYHNQYKCVCGHEWADTHSAACNDRCPKCNKEIEPFKSDVLEEEAGIYSRSSQTSMFTSEQMTGSGQLNMLDQINQVADVKRRLKSTPAVFWNDPGHGWFEANYSDLVLLDIHRIISGYSYRKGDKVYLEEDCDAAKYVKAIFGEHPENDPMFPLWKSMIRDEYRENIFIRNLKHYKP